MSRSTKPVIGIDLGGTHMQVGIVDAEDRLMARTRARTNAADGQNAVIDRIAEAVDDVMDDASLNAIDIAAVGVAAPGAIDIPRGIVVEAPNLGWSDTPLRSILKERLKCPIALDNDVNAAVWGEFHLGAGRGRTDLLGVWVGTGVGGGLIINQQLHHGAFFTAGEVGHTIINPDGEEGSRTVEDYASRTGMSRLIRAGLPSHPESILNELIDEKTGVTGSRALARAVDQDDAFALEVVNRGAHLLGIAIANWVTVLAFDCVVIGGGITEALGEPYLQKIRESFRAHVFPNRSRQCELRMTELEADAGLFGAAMLARQVV